MLGVAALLEVGAYFVPGVDHVLDLIAAPVAVTAGVIVSAATMTDLPPMIKWTAAIVAGGGAAGLVHGPDRGGAGEIDNAGPAASAIRWWPPPNSAARCWCRCSRWPRRSPPSRSCLVLLWLAFRLVRRLRGRADHAEPAK